MSKLFILLLIFNVGCASYQSGEYANIVSGTHPVDIPITGSLDETLSTDHYTVINFNFGNDTKEWLRVKKVRLDLKNEQLNKKVNIVVGNDLSTWAESIKHKVDVDQWNKSVIWGSIALVGVAVAVKGGSTGNTDMATAGVGIYSGGLGVLAVNGIIDGLEEMDRAKLFPRTHIYQPFSVPAGLYTKRWVLLKIDRRDIPSEVYFDVEYLDGKKAKYKVSI